MTDYAHSVRAVFDASHRVEDYPGCHAQHGHTFEVVATIEGPLEMDESGVMRVAGIADLHDQLDRVAQELDGRDLNAMLPGVVPTPENIAAWFLERVQEATRIEVRMGWRRLTGTAIRSKRHRI